MNILFITAENDRFSGAFLSLVKLATILQHDYHHHVVVILPKGGDGRELLKQNNIKSIVIRSGLWVVKICERNNYKSKIKFFLKGILNYFADMAVSLVIKLEHVNLIHINSLWTCVGARAALKCKIPFIWHIREFLEEDQSRSIWRREKGYELMRKSLHMVAISHSIYKKYAPIIGKEKITVILNGVDPATYYVKDHQIFQRSTVNLLIIGRICKEKGQIDAISACILLHKRGYLQLNLDVVGQGESEYVQSLKQFVKNNQADHYISFHESTRSPLDYYRKTDIVMMCSKSEAFGRVTVEGMMAGALVIGAESAATVEIIQNGKTGLMYTNGSEKLSDQIAYAIDHPAEAQTIARSGQQYALQYLTDQINAEHIDNLYRKLFPQLYVCGGGTADKNMHL